MTLLVRIMPLLIAGMAMLVPVAAPRGAEVRGQAKAQTCFACHGPDGHSGTPEVPSLAGQRSEFIAAQLHLFRDGGRKDAQMAPMTANLSDADIDDLAAFFSQVSPTPPEQPPDAAATAAAMPILQRDHCATCHGENFAGQKNIPRIAGQQRSYISWQLRAFRDGKRPGIDASMREVTKSMSNKDTNTLANYLSRLP